MPLHGGLLQELVLAYGVAVVLLMIAARLGVPSIVALIAAGMIAGPTGLGFVTSQANVDVMAEVGVALLLFTAGMEFSPPNCDACGRPLCRGAWRRSA